MKVAVSGADSLAQPSFPHSVKAVTTSSGWSPGSAYSGRGGWDPAEHHRR
jgi:hypothetical protein